MGAEELAEYIDACKEQLAANASKPPPPPDVFESYVRGITRGLGQVVAGAPTEVKEAIVDAFSANGWDLKAAAGEMNVDGLAATLDALGAAFPVAEEEADEPPDTTPSEDELSDLSLACSRLWDLDSNRLMPEQDYSINVQRGKKVYSKRDMASEPLFTAVNEEVLKRCEEARECRW